MKKSSELLIMALIGSCIAACQVTVSDNAEAEANLAQDRREAVHTAFAEGDDAVVAQYRDIWSARHVHARTAGDLIEMLAIAGQLLGRDVAHYHEYSNYITDKLQSSDLEVRGSALAALSNATDSASLRTLLDASSDERISIAAESVAALDYRYQTILADVSRADEVEQIQLESRKLCQTEHATAPLAAYCDRNGF